MSCIWTDQEKQIVLQVRRLIRARRQLLWRQTLAGTIMVKSDATHCAVIDVARDDRWSQRRACRIPPGAAGSARSARAAGSEPGSPADPGGVHQPGTTPPSTTRPCGDASLAKWVGSGRVTVWHVSPIPPLDVATEHHLTVRSFWKFISEIWKFSVEEQRTSNAVSISLWTTARLTDERS